MRTAAEFKEDVLGLVEVELDRAMADEQAAARKIQSLVGLDFRLDDESQRQAIRDAVARREGYVVVIQTLTDVKALIRNARI